MLNKMAFANALGLTVGVFYVLFYLLSLGAPEVFAFVFNAQFLGADVAALVVGDATTLGGFVGTLLTAVVAAWVMGFVWAWLYNRLAKQ